MKSPNGEKMGTKTRKLKFASANRRNARGGGVCSDGEEGGEKVGTEKVSHRDLDGSGGIGSGHDGGKRAGGTDRVGEGSTIDKKKMPGGALWVPSKEKNKFIGVHEGALLGDP